MQTSLTATSPTLDLSAIERAALAPSTKKQYSKEIHKMVQAGISPSNHQALQAYADTLKQSSRQFLKSALRLMTIDFEQDVKANATPANLKETQAALYRLEAMRGAVHVSQPRGQKANVWLSAAQVLHLTALCSGDTLENKRDWIVLGLLLGAGLRREELATLTFDAIKTLPTKNGKRTVIEVLGKGNKYRTIPISQKLGDKLREWREIAGPGRIARSLGRAGKLGESLSAVAIFELVARYGVKIGLPELAPHDLRRTYAQIGLDSGISLTQISVLLGHSSVQTTAKYLDLSLDINSTISDFIPLS